MHLLRRDLRLAAYSGTSAAQHRQLEPAFNTVLEPSHPSAESVTAALAGALKIEPSEAQSFIDAGKPLPLVTITDRRSDMIAALVRTCG